MLTPADKKIFESYESRLLVMREANKTTAYMRKILVSAIDEEIMRLGGGRQKLRELLVKAKEDASRLPITKVKTTDKETLQAGNLHKSKFKVGEVRQERDHLTPEQEQLQRDEQARGESEDEKGDTFLQGAAGIERNGILIDDPVQAFIVLLIEQITTYKMEFKRRWDGALKAIVYQMHPKESYIKMNSLYAAFDADAFVAEITKGLLEEGAVTYDEENKEFKFKFTITLNADAVKAAHNAGSTKLQKSEFDAIIKPFQYTWSGGLPYPASGSRTALLGRSRTKASRAATKKANNSVSFNFNSKGDLGNQIAPNNDFLLKYFVYGPNMPFSPGKEKAWYRNMRAGNKLAPRESRASSRPMRVMRRFLEKIGLQAVGEGINPVTGECPVALGKTGLLVDMINLIILQIRRALWTRRKRKHKKLGVGSDTDKESIAVHGRSTIDEEEVKPIKDEFGKDLGNLDHQIKEWQDIIDSVAGAGPEDEKIFYKTVLEAVKSGALSQAVFEMLKFNKLRIG